MCHYSKWSQSSFYRQHKHWSKTYLGTGLGCLCCNLWKDIELSEFKQMGFNEDELCRIPKYTVLSYTFSLFFVVGWCLMMASNYNVRLISKKAEGKEKKLDDTGVIVVSSRSVLTATWEYVTSNMLHVTSYIEIWSNTENWVKGIW